MALAQLQRTLGLNANRLDLLRLPGQHPLCAKIVLKEKSWDVKFYAFSITRNKLAKLFVP